ncbi:hypothetical protein L1987_23528 [Smallanthus sonchifolius]|uniref:Uncharacterized protein n=1 Tax=Smallanthus sonchifolius TaxID=185202 RepID=A0ACB9IIS6_9ASTR|nr:hypothetical protein L1987_23528 [Smallanthus sonchifolius]
MTFYGGLYIRFDPSTDPGIYVSYYHFSSILILRNNQNQTLNHSGRINLSSAGATDYNLSHIDYQRFVVFGGGRIVYSNSQNQTLKHSGAAPPLPKTLIYRISINRDLWYLAVLESSIAAATHEIESEKERLASVEIF